MANLTESPDRPATARDIALLARRVTILEKRFAELATMHAGCAALESRVGQVIDTMAAMCRVAGLPALSWPDLQVLPGGAAGTGRPRTEARVVLAAVRQAEPG